MANTKSIGVAFLDQDIIGAQYLLSDEQIGYTAAAQGTVTQATSKAPDNHPQHYVSKYGMRKINRSSLHE